MVYKNETIQLESIKSAISIKSLLSNQFSSLKNPIFSRWISLNGDYKHIFTYDVGDFRQKYSPLTLYSPDLDIRFEPEIFAIRIQVIFIALLAKKLFLLHIVEPVNVSLQLRKMQNEENYTIL